MWDTLPKIAWRAGLSLAKLFSDNRATLGGDPGAGLQGKTLLLCNAALGAAPVQPPPPAAADGPAAATTVQPSQLQQPAPSLPPPVKPLNRAVLGMCCNADALVPCVKDNGRLLFADTNERGAWDYTTGKLDLCFAEWASRVPRRAAATSCLRALTPGAPLPAWNAPRLVRTAHPALPRPGASLDNSPPMTLTSSAAAFTARHDNQTMSWSNPSNPFYPSLFQGNGGKSYILWDPTGVSGAARDHPGTSPMARARTAAT
jgi:hypothetical protein